MPYFFSVQWRNSRRWTQQVFRTVGVLLQHYTASQSNRPRLLSLSPLEPQISLHGAGSPAKSWKLCSLSKPLILWNPKDYHCFQKSSSLDYALSHMNQAHIFIPILRRTILILSSHLRLGRLNGILFEVSCRKCCTHFSFFPCVSRTLCPPWLVTQTILSD
jgi:hypothetical protein